MPETKPKSPLAVEVESNWPTLSYHYGFTFAELASMPRVIRELYAKELPKLLASRQLRAIEAAAYAWQPADVQSKIMDRLRVTLENGPTGEPKQQPQGIVPKNRHDLALLTAASGIGFVVEPKAKPEEKPQEVIPSA